MFKEKITVPGLGVIDPQNDFVEREQTSNGHYRTGADGVKKVFATADGKVEFIVFQNNTLAYVPSLIGYTAYYPVEEVSLERPVEGILMDLDGTSVRSEEFWMWIIEKSIASLTGNPRFELENADIPFVSGHSVAEHLSYAIGKYCPEKSLDDARRFYFEHVEHEMAEIMAGRGRAGAFTPAEGLRDLLLSLKAQGIKIGLVTSGLYEKAMPEIISAFRTLNMGDPVDFYDAIITAGTAFKPGQTGTLSELPIKPHPWLYAETGRFGLGIPYERRSRVLAVEDSGAGICSARLAGYFTVGIGGGNIEKSGTKQLCGAYLDGLPEVERFVLGK